MSIKEEIKSGKYDKKILSLWANGYTNKDICTKLGISEYTIRLYLKNMYSKYNQTRKIPLILKVLFNK